MLARAALAALLATAASAAPLLKAKQGSGGPGDWSQPGGPDFDWCALFVVLPPRGCTPGGSEEVLLFVTPAPHRTATRRGTRGGPI